MAEVGSCMVQAVLQGSMMCNVMIRWFPCVEYGTDGTSWFGKDIVVSWGVRRFYAQVFVHVWDFHLRLWL